MWKNRLLAAISLAATMLALTNRAGAQSSAHQPHPDITGVWRMDTTKFSKHDAQLASLTLTAVAHGDTLVVTTDVVDVGQPPFSFTTRYLPADRPAPAMNASSMGGRRVGGLSWAADTLVLSSGMASSGRSISVDERWSIDPAGHTLSRQQTAVDGPRVSRQTLVFTREMPASPEGAR